MTGTTTRADRMAQPTARDAVRAVAENHGACLRPVQLRRTNTDTGQVDQVLIPCGATLAASARRAPNGPEAAAGRPVPGRLAPRDRTHPRPPPAR